MKSKIYTFKSREPFYTKEKLGIKNNTVRKIDLNEERFLELITYATDGFDEFEIEIKIINAEDQKKNFIRFINDISIYDDLMIITWTTEFR